MWLKNSKPEIKKKNKKSHLRSGKFIFNDVFIFFSGAPGIKVRIQIF